MEKLTPSETQRYNRHLILPEVGLEGQLRLKSARVLLVGTGGLGSPSALYLAAAGIGTLGLVDFDVVDYSNLHRQVIHGTGDVGRRKVDSAEDSIKDINPEVTVIKHDVMFTSQNAMEIAGGYDLIVDGTDNFPTRYLVNDVCVLTGKPNVYGSIFRFDGQATVFAAPGGPCYRCLFPEPPPPGSVPNCAEGGVLGILPGVIGLIQATEAVKLILGKGSPLVGRLLMYDALGMSFQEIRIKRDPDCPVCGDNPSVHGLIDYEQFCGISAQNDTVADNDVSVSELDEKLKRGDDFVLLDVREPHELEICRIPGSMHIPMGQVPARLNELDPTKEIVVQCRSGARSGQVAEFLRGQGYPDVHNLAGGILAWADEIDPSMTKY